jgi:hypothetical protein
MQILIYLSFVKLNSLCIVCYGCGNCFQSKQTLFSRATFVHFYPTFVCTSHIWGNGAAAAAATGPIQHKH